MFFIAYFESARRENFAAFAESEMKAGKHDDGANQPKEAGQKKCVWERKKGYILLYYVRQEHSRDERRAKW